MQIRNGIIEAIGNTPLIKLEHASQATGKLFEYLHNARPIAFMQPNGTPTTARRRSSVLECPQNPRR